MTPTELFETAMLVLFSLGWCVSVATMLWTRTPSRKSLHFVGLIWAGYLLGICAKLADWWATGMLSPVVWFYVWNATMILIDFALVVALSRPQPRIFGGLASKLLSHRART